MQQAMASNRNRLILENEITSAIIEIYSIPAISACECSPSITAIKSLYTILQCLIELTHFGDLSHYDCADVYREGRDLIDKFVDVIYTCAKDNTLCMDPLNLKYL